MRESKAASPPRTLSPATLPSLPPPRSSLRAFPPLLSLLFLLLLSLSFPLSTAAAAAAPYGPASPWGFTPCWQTFEEFERDDTYALLASAVPTYLPLPTWMFAPLNAYSNAAALCPANCTQTTARTPARPAVVYGSFPYHASSSVCLAAVHAGIISDNVGGGVLVSRFYRHDWSNSSTQTIFPFTSSQGTLSNGVSSVDVERSLYSVPSNASEWSFTVRGRGDHFVQRRVAPFPPRSDHLHLLLHSEAERSPQLVTINNVHVIIGGYNGTHYLNDVWCGVQMKASNTLPSYLALPDLTWTHLPDAPFTPRSSMLSRQPGNGGFGQAPWLEKDPLIFLLGGQTNHSCGLYELGVCSDEVWQLNLTVTRAGVPSIVWSSAPVWHLPLSPARCGVGMLVASNVSSTAPLVPDTFLDYVTLMGGQDSYTDATCTFPPITSNDVWGGQLRWNGSSFLLSAWSRQPFDAPFSPRRVDVSCHPLYPLDDTRSSCLVSGGIRYLSLTPPTPPATTARLTSATLFAEVWLTHLDRQGQATWGTWDSRPTIPRNNSSLPLTGLPVPLAGAVSRQGGYPTQPLAADLSFGGWTTASSLLTWQSTRPTLDPSLSPFEVDWSQMVFNLTMVASIALPTSDEFQQLRCYLPLNSTLTEADLNDPNSSYALGTPWMLLSALGATRQGTYSADLSTIHYRPMAYATHPNHSSPFFPLAASSLATGRPALNFPLSRHSHRIAITPTLFYPLTPMTINGLPQFPEGRSFISGGAASPYHTTLHHHHNDFILAMRPRCLPPVDPSYTDALGPIILAPTDYVFDEEWGAFYYGNTLSVTETPIVLKVACAAGFHFEPPTTDSEVGLQCGPDGMWVDVDLLSVRRCTRNRLNCTWPLTDLGGYSCEPSPPLIQELHASYEVGGVVVSVAETNAVTLTDFPLLAGVTLTIAGSVFWDGTQVGLRTSLLGCDGVVSSCGPYHCREVTLQPSSIPAESGSVCYNVSEAGGLECARYARSITCTLPALPGGDLYVWVGGGKGGVAEVDPATGRAVGRLSCSVPVLSALIPSPDTCTAQNLNLLDCPPTSLLNLTVCATRASIGDADPPAIVVLAGLGRWDVLDCRSQGVDVASFSRCFDCVMYPRLGTQPIRLLETAYNTYSQQPASITFLPCTSGSSVDFEALVRGNASSLCRTCPPGTSTNNNTGVAACTPCPAGYHSDEGGVALCTPCTPGTVAPYMGMAECQRCPPNSYANSSAQTRCEVCELNQYLVVGDEADVGVAGVCVDCPDGATCSANGTITEQGGSYLLISQAAGTASSVICNSLACVAPSTPEGCSWGMAAAADVVVRSQLSVVNCCAQGRWPAVVSDPQLYSAVPSLRISQGRNVLCATCLPGHTQLSGRCIPCDSAHAGAITLLLLVALLLTYALHRLPHDWTGRARLSIVSNFVQLAVLFLAKESWPKVASLIHATLLLPDFSAARGEDMETMGLDRRDDGGDDSSPFCIMPLTDGQRILTTLLSPLLGFVLLGVLILMQYASHFALSRGQPHAVSLRLYALLCIPSKPSKGEDEEEEEGGESAGAVADASVAAVSLPPVSLLPYQRSAVRLLLLSYTGMTLLSLSFFHWQKVGEYGERLYDYPALWPQAVEYLALRPLMLIVIITVVAGLPIALTAFLAFHHRMGHLAQLPLRHDEPKPPGMDSGEEATPPPPTGLPSQSPAAAPVAGPLPPHRVRLEELLIQLTAMYRPSCWWMPPFVLARKLLIAATFTLVTGRQVWAWLTLLLTLALAFHQHSQPYTRARDNAFEASTHLALIFITATLSLYPPPYMTAALLSTFNTLFFAPLLPMLVEAIYRQHQAWRATRREAARMAAAAAAAEEEGGVGGGMELGVGGEERGEEGVEEEAKVEKMEEKRMSRRMRGWRGWTGSAPDLSRPLVGEKKSSDDG